MSYEFFTAADFARDPFFRAWVLEQDARATEYWTDWLSQHPNKKDDVSEAKALLFVLQEKLETIDDTEIEMRINATLQRIRSGAKPLTPTRSRFRLPAIAAAVACLILSAAWWVTRRGPDSFLFPNTGKNSLGLSVIRSDKQTSREIVLHDGSRVRLSPGSELSYPETFDSLSRIVYLEGEAFFEISRDTKRPFRVVSSDLITEVLGTSFTVSSFESSPEASVSVKSGKVSVLTADQQTEVMGEKNGMILSPNQEAIYRKNEAKLTKRLSPKPEIVVPVPDNELVFDAVPVAEVLEKISKRYSVTIEYSNELLANCFFTGDLTDNSLYEQLDFISRIANARYDIVEGQVLVHSSGCP